MQPSGSFPHASSAVSKKKCWDKNGQGRVKETPCINRVTTLHAKNANPRAYALLCSFAEHKQIKLVSHKPVQ